MGRGPLALAKNKGDLDMQAANPYLNFNGNTEEAFRHYRSVFGGDFAMLVRFRDFGDAMGVPADHADKIAHIALPLGGGGMLMGTDVVASRGDSLTAGNNFYISLNADAAEEAVRLFEGLSAGGRVEMPLQKTEWAEQYGSCVDKFGVQWMVSYAGNVRFGG
jgi:PhnB protein